MASLKCPNCGMAMKENKEGGLLTEDCPSCGGVFLDKGELNTLATGMKGDIEFCSVDDGFASDRFPTRLCPKCPDKQMRKINLLHFSDLVFDHCASCGGFFLDKGEVAKMNQELRSLTPNRRAEEYRATHGKHLVRLDQTNDAVPVGYLGVSKTVAVSYIRVLVFFGKDMPPAIRLFQEAWPLRIAKGFGLFWGRDIKTGDDEFDSVFRVQGENEAAIAAHLDPAARQALLAFAKSGRSIYGRTGSLDVTASGVVYVEGPYTTGGIGDVVERSKPVIEELVQIADKIEAIPASL